ASKLRLERTKKGEAMMSEKFWAASLAILMSSVSGAAFAQAAPPAAPAASPAAPAAPASALEEIVVTARKTTENVQNAPASIDVVEAKELTRSGVVVPTDLSKLLPSAMLNAEGATAQVFIRGVGSRVDFPWTTAASAITHNGIVIPRMGTMGLLFDLSSAQEISGPQGTL